MSTPDLSAFNFSFDPTLDTWAVSNEPAELDSSEIFLPNGSNLYGSGTD